MTSPDRPPGHRPKQQGAPEIQAAQVDRAVGVAAGNQRRFDNPQRRSTLTAFPSPPAQPREYAPTLPAPSTHAVTLPATADPSESSGASSGRAEDREAVLARELAKVRAEKAELERQARVKAEAAGPSHYPPPVAPPVAPAPIVVQQGVSSETLEAYRKAQTKLMLGIAGFLVLIGAPAALWLTNAATSAAKATERTQVQVTEVARTTDAAKVQTRDTNKELDDLKKQLAAERAYNREVWRRMGVQVPKREGDPDPPQLETSTPARRPGAITPAPVLVVTTPPP